MTGEEVRQIFLEYFEEKGHKIVPSSSLIPHGDPTLLLTSAGMVQFKPYFLGQEKPPCSRMVSCQKCFRATDIESVGDSNHLTFFEMLGNFSVGDYFKEGAITLALEFVLKQLGIPKELLWITVFLDDDEAFDIWRKNDISKDRIIRFGEEDNFWGPAGDSGPCGPSSEIHYDFGEEVGCGKPSCGPNCDCGRFSEIWNLVFVQFNQDEKGRRSSLSRCHIDTGMGLERTAAVMQNKTSVYQTDFFAPIMELISRLSYKNYGEDNNSDNSMRVVAEHGRGIAFLIADGVLPDNEGRGYVLRRLLRRAALFGRRLGLEKPFLSEVAGVAIKHMGKVYPELVSRREFILKVIESEEKRFSQTLSTGLELLDDMLTETSSRVRNKIGGKQVFKLYDTYGFPVELTQEIAERQGFSVDIEGFKKEMEKQRERARKVTISEKVGLSGDVVFVKQCDIVPTRFVGYSYSNLKHTSKIHEIWIDNRIVDSVKEGQKANLVLDATPFYAEMGGQVGDTGEIVDASKKRFIVSNTLQLPQGVIFHQGYVARGKLSKGDEVEAIVDCERRMDIARNHTATHLLQFALRRVLGEHVQQRGSLVAMDRLRFDFSHLKAMTVKEIEEVQHIVNQKIRENLPVYDEDIKYEKAIEEGAIALFDEKYGDVVRVLKVGRPPVSIELCGGTHVTATSEIGLLIILTESGIGGGLRRIEAVTGRGTEQMIERKISTLENNLSEIQAELETEQQRVKKLERQLAKQKAEELLQQTETVNGVKIVSAIVPLTRPEILREIADILRSKLKSVIVVLGTVHQGKPAFLVAITPDLVKKNYHAGHIVKQVATVTAGSGGGKADLAQGGGKDKDKLGEALKLVRSMI